MEIKRNKERIYYRDYSAFNKDAYLNDINSINWNSVLNVDEIDDLNTLTGQVMDTLTMTDMATLPICAGDSCFCGSILSPARFWKIM
jgi:hypothetical protein